MTVLVVVTGPPASGKSTLARELATELHMPYLSKDELKERLYEIFGNARELEEPIEEAALAVLFSLARTNLDASVDVLVESNFRSPRDAALFDELTATILQVHCRGDADELADDFAERAAAGKRHPGHDDHPADAEDVRRRIEAGEWDALPGVGRLVEVDATADTGELARRIHSLLEDNDLGGS